MDHNPYDPPRAEPNDRRDVNEVNDVNNPDDLDDLNDLLLAEVEVKMTDAQAAAVRQPLLSHEASIQSVGSVMLLGGVFLILGPLTGLSLIGDQLSSPGSVVSGVLLTAYGALSLRAGLNLRRLEANNPLLHTLVLILWTVSSSPLSLLGLWAFYLLYSKAGTIVLSQGYQEIRRRTPHLLAAPSRMNQLIVFVMAVVIIDMIASRL